MLFFLFQKTSGIPFNHTQWAKSPKKKTVWRSAYGTQNTAPYCQKYTPAYCFFGDGGHGGYIINIIIVFRW